MAATNPATERERDADAAAARGDVASARRLLEEATALAPQRLESWLKLATMCRAGGDIQAGLGAVAGALRVDPLCFLGLLLKAKLLDQAGRPEEAAEFYGYALAQRPETVPPGLAGAVGKAERRTAEHRQALFERLLAAAPQSPPTPEAERFARNIARLTRPYHSEPTHFHYPGLVEREFHDRAAFPWLGALEAATDAITDEFERLIAQERGELVPYIHYPDDVPLRQWAALNRSRDWTAIHLLQNGRRIEANARHCPQTMALLGQIPQPVVSGRSPNAMFSLLAPRTRIPPHHGVANTRLVCHLPLIVPEGCWFRVGAERRAWRRGQAWIFDDTIEHEAANDSDELRVILIVDCWHPGLSQAERDTVAAMMAATDLGLAVP